MSQSGVQASRQEGAVRPMIDPAIWEYFAIFRDVLDEHGLVRRQWQLETRRSWLTLVGGGDLLSQIVNLFKVTRSRPSLALKG
jgi:hypothetical protein